MLARVSETIARFRMCEHGERVGVACSGGPDSVALLTILAELAPSLGVTVGVVHLNHRLRGAASDSDESFVRRLADSMGLEMHVESVDLASRNQVAGGNLEQAGRDARYEWFQSLIERGEFQKIATGHTRSDQAETVLFRLLRGAGPDGLSAILPAREPGVIRPLLSVDRTEIEAFLAERGLDFCVDESNADRHFSRNRIRHELLPALRRDWNPRFDGALARLGAQAAEDAEYWRARVERREQQLLREAPGGLTFEIDQVSRLEPAIRRRLMRRAMERVGGAGRYEFQHVEALRLLVENPSAGARVSLPGLTAERSCGKVRLLSGLAHPAKATVLDPPDERGAPDGRTRIRVELRPQEPSDGSYTKPNWVAIDWSKVPKPLVLRTWRPGDRLSQNDGSDPRKLSDLLQASAVPSWDRERWPVLASVAKLGASDDTIVWARGFGVSSHLRASGNIREALRVFEFDEAGRDWTGPNSWEAISAGL